MATFETEMKRAYSEALAPYGFKKVKGRYPYFVRMVGKEILQVITYYKDKGLEPEQVFEMKCGITTVYTKEINLACSYRHNDSWLHDYRSVYLDSHPFCSREDVPKHAFRYEMPEELYMQRLEEVEKRGSGVIKVVSPYPLPSMQEAIEHTLDLTREEIIPVFDTVTDLKTCAEYFQKYDSSCMRIDERAPFNWELNYREQLFNLKVYNTIDELVEAQDKNRELRIQMREHRIEQKWYGYAEKSEEESEEEKKKRREKRQKRIELYEKLFHDPEIHAEALAELERRRQRNTETLRGYGLL